MSFDVPTTDATVNKMPDLLRFVRSPTSDGMDPLRKLTSTARISAQIRYMDWGRQQSLVRDTEKKSQEEGRQATVTVPITAATDQ